MPEPTLRLLELKMPGAIFAKSGRIGGIDTHTMPIVHSAIVHSSDETRLSCSY